MGELETKIREGNIAKKVKKEKTSRRTDGTILYGR